MDPRIRTINKLDPRGQGTIRPEPGEGNGGRVEGSPDVYNTTTSKEGKEREALLSLEGSEAFKALLSIDLSKTVLKSPQTTVATDG